MRESQWDCLDKSQYCNIFLKITHIVKVLQYCQNIRGHFKLLCNASGSSRQRILFFHWPFSTNTEIVYFVSLINGIGIQNRPKFWVGCCKWWPWEVLHKHLPPNLNPISPSRPSWSSSSNGSKGGSVELCCWLLLTDLIKIFPFHQSRVTTPVIIPQHTQHFLLLDIKAQSSHGNLEFVVVESTVLVGIK